MALTNADRAEAVEVMARGIAGLDDSVPYDRLAASLRRVYVADSNAALDALLAAGFVVKKENADG
jgi:hypothetical protein